MELAGLCDKNPNLQEYHREPSADPASQGGLRKIDLGQGVPYTIQSRPIRDLTSQGRGLEPRNTQCTCRSLQRLKSQGKGEW